MPTTISSNATSIQQHAKTSILNQCNACMINLTKQHKHANMRPYNKHATTCNAIGMQQHANHILNEIKLKMDRPQPCPNQWPLTPKLRHQKARHACTHIGP